MGKLESDDNVTVEELLEGSFANNNNGHICGDTNPVCNKAECLAHYSFKRSNKEVMVVVIQGCDHFLFDPEVASKEVKSSEEFFFCTGNLSISTINNFIESHSTNATQWYCELLQVSELTNE